VRYLLPALVVTLVGFSTAQAAPAKASPFGPKSFGDGGGYKHPDTAVGQYFEAKPQFPEALKEEEKGPAKVVARAVKPESPAAAPAPAAAASPAPVSRERPRPRPQLDAPIQKPALAAQAAKTAAVSDDSDRDDARRDYETKLFGAAPEPRRAGLADSKEAAAPFASAADARLGEGMLFVSLELDPQEAGSLRDAVAGLGATASFRPDTRFPPIPGEHGAVRISGWLPVSRLGDAIARPGVKRVSVERGSRPAADDSVAGVYLVTLRVGNLSRSDESIAESVRTLSDEAGFKLSRVLGIESIPGGGATALVSGTIPVSRLSRALGLPSVVRIASADPVSAPAPAGPAAPSQKTGFLAFVMDKALWLVLLTLLLALPSIGGAVKKGLSVFVPYR